MNQKTQTIQKRYDGYLQTNCLWKENVVSELNQFSINTSSSKIDFLIDEKLRLGKYVERFVSYQLKQEKSIEIIAENIQIQRDKLTLGELDCLILKNKKPIHLEIVYKFYLYDNTVGTNEIEHFIGPNRKDALQQKLTKLKEKQLPLLYTIECKELLKTLHLSTENINQYVLFKAQLFLPYTKQDIQLEKLNPNCVVGFYIKQKELKLFSDCKFYIPIKKDWLVVPHENVSWMNINEFEESSFKYLDRKFSPLCWLKNYNGEIEKFFLVWY